MKLIIKDLELSECLDFLGSNYIGRLAFISKGNPFIIPITYYYDSEENCILSYASIGHKIEAMRISGSVALQVDDIESIQHWRSVLVHGIFEEFDGSTAKKYLHRFAEGVQVTVTRKKDTNPKFIQDFSSRLQERGIPIMYRITINDITGKFRDS